MRKVKDIEDLKKICKDKHKDFFIWLNHGVRSSKTVFFDSERNLFSVYNEIDGSMEELTEKEIQDNSITNIGKAIKMGAFYYEE